MRSLELEEFDLVVVGGGVTGCGAALDAASRGLKVALIEQRDLAAGTSSRSSKMFHGGLRYLEQFQFGLVREALRERNLMIRTLCPYLVQPTRFIYPLRNRIWERAYVGAGILLYDLLAWLGKSTLPRHSHLSKAGLRQQAPGLALDGLIGGIAYTDTVFDDARHTVILGRTAAKHGAVLATSVRATSLEISGDRIAGVGVHDLETGHRFPVRASAVLNTTGVWTDEIERLAGETSVNVQASKGVHLLVPRDRIELESGLILRTEKSVLFVIPWDLHWIIGTTDTPWDLHRAHPAASKADILYLLSHVNTVLRVPLSESDVVGVYAGLRPLLKGESDATSKLSREHSVRRVRPGLVSVAGGKYTTYRVMAEDAIDAIARELGRDVPDSRTELIPLIGAGGPTDALSAIPGDRLHRLIGRYGDRVVDLAALIEDDPGLGQPVPGADAYIRAEVVYACTHEGSLHLDDILTRRTRISIETKHRGTESAREVAELVAPILGWDTSTVDREVDHYVARVTAERDSQSKPDDETADAARLGAPDVRLGA